MTLRSWQRECSDHAMLRYKHSQHYFCQATPAAGKTRLAAEIGRRLLVLNQVDLVVCFAPSCQVVISIQNTFEAILERSFDGKIGSVGLAVTYQSLDHQDATFWRLFERFRVFAVFDEIHHCSAGSDALVPNSWGQRVIQEVQDKAAFTLALSGTPWRSDEQAIALARYSDPDGRLIMDYQYSMRRAVAEQVCRKPEITLVDHNLVRLDKSGIAQKEYSSLRQLLKSSDVTYEVLVTHESLCKHLLEQGNKKLNSYRGHTPDAAALAVASSIDHAYQLAIYLTEMGEAPVVVTTRTTDANSVIEQFKTGTQRWIIAVGMISEGTDIPRLQVCCYLSRIRTELYFRQVLGRVLRYRNSEDHSSSLLMIAEPELVKFAKRVDNDLPGELGVLSFQQFLVSSNSGTAGASDQGSDDGFEQNGGDDGTNGEDNSSSGMLGGTTPVLSMSFEGMFRHQLLALF